MVIETNFSYTGIIYAISKPLIWMKLVKICSLWQWFFLGVQNIWSVVYPLFTLYNSDRSTYIKPSIQESTRGQVPTLTFVLLIIHFLPESSFGLVSLPASVCVSVCVRMCVCVWTPSLSFVQSRIPKMYIRGAKHKHEHKNLPHFKLVFVISHHRLKWVIQILKQNSS